MSTLPFDLDILDPKANQGYLPQPIPTTRDAEINELLLKMIDERCVARFNHNLQVENALVLRVFAERMASMAVRNRDEKNLRTGLIALLLSWRGPDARETLTIFPLFYDAIRKLDLNHTSFIESFRQIIGDELTTPFVEFLGRSEANKSLQVMGYSEGADQDGFRYIRNW